MTDNYQERTHKPSDRRLQDAKKSGIIPRSNELNFLIVILLSALIFDFTSGYLFRFLHSVMTQFFTPAYSYVSAESIPFIMRQLIVKILLFLVPICLIYLTLRITLSSVFGGFYFVPALLIPKSSRLNPFESVRKIFSINSIVEMTKTLIKFITILCCVFGITWHFANSFINLERMPIHHALGEAIVTLKSAFFWLILMLLIFTVMDVPYQFWLWMKKLRMTERELREESKEGDRTSFRR